MKRNMGTNDRIIRAAIAGAALVGIKSCPSKVGKVGSLLIAALMGGTAAAGTCPAYQLFGVDTLGK